MLMMLKVKLIYVSWWYENLLYVCCTLTVASILRCDILNNIKHI